MNIGRQIVSLVLHLEKLKPLKRTVLLTSITRKLFLSLFKTENFFVSFQLRRRRKTDLPPLFKRKMNTRLQNNKEKSLVITNKTFI